MQQFISDSPWSGPGLIGAVQAKIGQHPVWDTGAMLVIDESADEKAGETSVGAGRQHNGPLGKVDLCQVGVFASLVRPEVNSWIDGELSSWKSDLGQRLPLSGNGSGSRLSGPSKRSHN
jgi:SRSO17 transposase